jgi:signal transduction histidine kinase
MDFDGHHVRVLVEDNGKGFDYRPEAGPKEKSSGLAALKERMDLLGGELRVDTQPGQGTRITMDLPAGPAPE